MIRLLPLLVLFLSACASSSGINLSHYSEPHASKDDFLYCYGYNCSKKMRLGFSKHEWKEISKIFKRPAKDATVERLKIGKAIALMEKYTGKLAGTEGDLPKAPIRRKTYQELDCIDETVNTTQYLKFMADANFLKFHSVGKPAFKGGFINGVYPHNTATVIENETGKAYVIDSYIHKNGIAPNIRGLENWKRYRADELSKAENLNRL